MSKIESFARFTLFGGESMVNKPSLLGVMGYKIVNAGRQLVGMKAANYPGFIDYAKVTGADLWARLTGQGLEPGIPAGVPKGIFTTVDGVIKARGGMVGPNYNFWLSRTRCTSHALSWILFVDYAPAAPIEKLAGLELAIEDALARRGQDLNVRIMAKPLRIEIDKPVTPVVTLANLWPYAGKLPINERLCILGKTWAKGADDILTMALSGEDFSTFIAGSPGSGKTQLSMAMLLTLAYANSPERLSMLIIDPKAIDWRPFGKLPHLALPVITEPTKAVEAIAGLVNEMDKRTQQAAKGDTSFLQQSILIYVDELSDLLNSLPTQQAEQAAMGLQRLAQKGRGVGFIVVAATQRVYDVPASAYSKLNARIVGRMRNANDSVAATGIKDTATNKLPGRGAFELYCSDQMGLRIQAPFVADSQKADYADRIGVFIADILARWQRAGPGVTLANNAPADPQPEPETQRVTIPVELYDRMKGVDRVSQYQLRQWHREIFGRDLNPKAAKSMIDALFGGVDQVGMQ